MCVRSRVQHLAHMSATGPGPGPSGRWARQPESLWGGGTGLVGTWRALTGTWLSPGGQVNPAHNMDLEAAGAIGGRADHPQAVTQPPPPCWFLARQAAGNHLMNLALVGK